MSEKIVIIGNGFDLRHFLPTKYNHLITILREIENLDFDTISEVNFEKLFGNLFKEKDEWFYESIKEYYETQEMTFDIQELKSIQTRVKTNNWFQYLKSVEDDKIETWIDFETEIIRVLSVISNYFDLFNSERFGKTTHRLEHKNQIHFAIYQHLDDKFFKNKFQKRILGFFGFLEIRDYQGDSLLNADYTIVIDNEIQYYKEKIFFDQIYKSLEEFIGVFNDYIEKIVNVFNIKFKEEKKENFIRLGNKFLFDKVSKIFSFNYTDTYNKLYKSNVTVENELRSEVRAGFFKGTDFLHGKSVENWNNDLENLKIVLGVNDIDPLLKNHKLFQFTKYFQKLHKETDYLFLDEIIKSLQKPTKGMMSYTFYFWGHSLDISDKEYINDVFKVVTETSSKIKIFYHSISGKADQLKNLLNIIDKNTIESMMKNGKLLFIESTSQNLFEEL